MSDAEPPPFFITYRLPLFAPVIAPAGEIYVAIADICRALELTLEEVAEVGVGPDAAVRISFADIDAMDAREPDRVVPGALCTIPVLNVGARTTTGKDVSAFTLAYSALVLALRTIRAMTLEPLSAPNIHALPPIITYVVHKGAGDREPTEAMFFYDKRMGEYVPQALHLSEDQLSAITVAASQLARRQPSFVVRDLRAQAEVSRLVHHDNAGACIRLALAAEVALDSVLLSLMWEEGARPVDASSVWEKALKTRVKQQYHLRLGGQWNPDNPATSIGIWFDRVAALRNRAVHAGYQPTDREVSQAERAVQGLLDYVIGLVCGAAERYPQTLLKLLSPDSALAQTSGAGHRAVEATISQVEALSASFDKWFREFAAL